MTWMAENLHRTSEQPTWALNQPGSSWVSVVVKTIRDQPRLHKIKTQMIWIETFKRCSVDQDQPPGLQHTTMYCTMVVVPTSSTTTLDWATSNSHGFGKTLLHIYPQQSTTFKITVASPLVWGKKKRWHEEEDQGVRPSWSLHSGIFWPRAKCLQNHTEMRLSAIRQFWLPGLIAVYLLTVSSS